MNEFYLIEKRVSETRVKVELYQELYGNKNSINVLNSTFPECFAVMQESLLFEIVCRICALFDPAKTGGSKNMTLDHLVLTSGESYTKDAHIELEEIKFDFSGSGLKKLRNKLYAHNDLNVYLKKTKFTTSFDYEFLIDLLRRIFIFVRNLGLNSGKIKKNQTILRETRLPEKRNGHSLIKALSDA